MTAPHSPQPLGVDVTWQTVLRPFMQRMLAALAIVFFVIGGIQMWRIEKQVVGHGGFAADSLQAAIGLDCKSIGGGAPAVDCARWQTVALLEATVLERRYHQATAALVARLWLKALGFITGMVLALVGAAFILGKLTDVTPTNLTAEGQAAKLVLVSASPGIILATLGTALIITTILSNPPTTVQDGAAYASYDRGAVAAGPGSVGAVTAPPPDHIPGLVDTAGTPR